CLPHRGECVARHILTLHSSDTAGAGGHSGIRAFSLPAKRGNRMLTRELLQSYGWPDNELTEQAVDAALALLRSGLAGEAALVWLDQVYERPARYLGDPVLAPLARACLRQSIRSVHPMRCADMADVEECECVVACRD